MGEPLNVLDYARLAEEALEPGAFGYFAGGAGDERALAENVAAFARLRLRPRVLVDVATPRRATTVLGTPVSMPLLVAPTAIQRHGASRRGARNRPRGRCGRDDHVPLDARDGDAGRGRGRPLRERRAGSSSTSSATAA